MIFLTLGIVLSSFANFVLGGTWTPALAHWHIGDDNNTCILLAGYFSFNLPYELSNGQSSEARVSIPGDAQAEGTCTNWVQSFTLKWNVTSSNGNASDTNDAGKTDENQVMFRLQQHGVNSGSAIDGYYELSDIDAIVNTNSADFPDAADPDKIYELHASGLHAWSAPLELSYFCGTAESIPLNIGTFETAGVQAQAFHIGPIGTSNMDFGPRSYCAADVNRTIAHGFLVIAMLFLVSLGIAILVTRKRRISYEIL